MENEYSPDGLDAGARITQRIKDVLGTDDGEKVMAVKKLLQSETDRRVEAGVRRFREETLPKHLEKALAEREAKKPEDIIATKERALDVAARLGVDYQAVSRLFLAEGDLGDRADAFEELVKGAQISYVEEKLKLGGANPPRSAERWGGAISRADLSRMSPTQVTAALEAGKLNGILGRNR